MGYYIETKMNKGKADFLKESVGAKEITRPLQIDPTGEEITICVVDNDPFEAVGIAFSQEELECFSGDDGRCKRWLTLPRETVIKLCPRVKHALVRRNGGDK